MPTKKPLKSQRPASDARSVLLVDDDPLLLQMLAVMLTARGWDVRTQPDGLRALQFLSENCVDAVVVDARMPGLAGAGLLEHVKRVCPGTKLVLLTGVATQATRERVAELSGKVVEKGDPQDLLEALDG